MEYFRIEILLIILLAAVQVKFYLKDKSKSKSTIDLFKHLKVRIEGLETFEKTYKESSRTDGRIKYDWMKTQEKYSNQQAADIGNLQSDFNLLIKSLGLIKRAETYNVSHVRNVYKKPVKPQKKKP